MAAVKSANHTPGPWAVETCLDNGGARNGLYLIQTAERRRTLAKVDRNFAGTYAETEANTRLMAAAPDLLAACRDAYRLIDTMGNVQATKVLVDAIAKAEGR